MSAKEWQTLGIALMTIGSVLLVVSQLLLSRWHRKMLETL